MKHKPLYHGLLILLLAIGFLTWPGTVRAQSDFNIIQRSAWGADETMRYWTPDMAKEVSSGNGKDPCEDLKNKYGYEIQVTRTVTQSPGGERLTWPLDYAKSIEKIIIHHTDSEIRDINGDQRINTRDYKEIVRAIYRYHTVTRGWGDIGYHYVIDPLGNIYEGRYGGDKVVGGHTACYNNGSIGIAVIGNYQDEKVPEPAMEALIWLVGNKSKQYGIDPVGESSFRGKRIPNVIAHRDVGATACPGEKLYAALTRIRERAALIYKGREFQQDLSGETLDYNADPLSQLSNVVLKPNERKKLTLQFKNTGKETWNQDTWLHVALNNNPNARIVPLLADKKFVAANVQQHSVGPGGTGSFEVEIEGGYVPGDYEFEVAPVVNGRYKVSRSAIFIPFSVEPVRLDYELIRQEMPKGTIFQGQKIESFVELKNTGNVTWHNYGANQITLGTEAPRDHKSIFVKENPSRVGYLVQSEVPPGQIGRFSIPLEVPTNVQKRVVERFTPVIEGVDWLQDKNLGFSATIKKPKHLARLQKLDSLRELLPGEMQKITIRMENKGDLAWDEDNMSVALKSEGLKLFKSQLVPRGETVKPGQSIDMDFWVQAPYQAGQHAIGLKANFNRVPIRGGSTQFIIQVPEPRLRAQMVDQGERSRTIRPNQIEEVTVKFKNLGNTVWRREGPNAVHLGTAEPQDRVSQMYYRAGWQGKFRAAQLSEEEVKPNEIGTFTFQVRSLTRGVRREYFQLVSEGTGWIPGSLVRWDFRIFGEKSTDGTANGDAKANQEQAALITKARQTNPPTSSSTATNISTAPSTPSSTPAQETTAVAATPKLMVTERPFRVRLSYSEPSARITSSQAYNVLNENNDTLFQANGGQTVTLRRVNNNFQVQLGSETHSASIIRFTPANQGIMQIASWHRPPAWNPDLNDNEFRGTIEVRLIDSSVAYINELPLEDYMKGLAEVSNSTPLEKQKAIAVLARTYARFYMEDANRKFPGMPYDSSDDPAIFQKYLGYGVEKRSPNFVGAVALTRDEVVTYQGRLIKTPYFNQSSGKTLSAEEVWGWKDTPYLQSIADPWCVGLTQQGHGVGLSGCGAEAQAKEGKTYDDIIKYYYQGVEIQEITLK
ncbi:MAG: SpoIID/LytB domain-containing protein [Candidatus Peregrinibacteria bacterium]